MMIGWSFVLFVPTATAPLPLIVINVMRPSGRCGCGCYVTGKEIAMNRDVFRTRSNRTEKATEFHS